MANTERLDLFKVPSDPAEQEIMNFNTETMMNENWEKIDKKVALVNEEGKVVNKDGTLAGGVEDLQNDFMYQIPTIVDTQIRINRLSNTDRLFFKLDADLTGDITISTDSGSTEKPLVDIDQNQITHLEKGFVEVVADADFFILRNRGISDADRQALIDIVNEAERNESDLKTQFVDMVNDKTGSALPVDATWFDVKNAITSMPNKKFATGEMEGTGALINVTHLPFRPSLVVIISTSSDVNKRGGIDILLDSDEIVAHTHDSADQYRGQTGSVRFEPYFGILNLRLSSSQITDNGFRFYDGARVYKTLKWYACE